MSKYDNLLRLGGAEVVDVREYFKRHNDEIKKRARYEQLSEFEYTITAILKLVEVDKSNVDNYDLKFVIRKKS
jgi:hypothetical protein